MKSDTLFHLRYWRSTPLLWPRLYWKYVDPFQSMTPLKKFDYLLKTASLTDFKLFINLREIATDSPCSDARRTLDLGRYDIINAWITEQCTCCTDSGRCNNVVRWLMDNSINWNDSKTVKFLLDKGHSGPNDVIRNLPLLHTASGYGYIQIVKILIVAGADPYALDAQNKTVEDHASTFYAWTHQDVSRDEMLEYFAQLKATL